MSSSNTMSPEWLAIIPTKSYLSEPLNTSSCWDTIVNISLHLFFRMRYLLLPLLLFLVLIILFDAVSIFAYITNGHSEKSGDYHFRWDFWTSFLDIIWQKKHHFRYIRYMAVPEISRNVFFFVIVKLVYSLVLIQAVIKAYRRNLQIRGGRSPFRVRSMSPRVRDVENPSGSPKLQLSNDCNQKKVWIC